METRGKNRRGVRITHGNGWSGVAKVKFTPTLWNKWLTEFNAEPSPELVKGIETFRALCREPLDRGSDSPYSAPTREGKDK